MTLGEFHTLVKDSLRRGTTLSTQIVQQTQLAVQWLERNYTMSYMEQFRLFQLEANKRTIEFPTNAVHKAFKMLRLVDTDGGYLPLNKVEPEDLTRVVSSLNATGRIVPSQYFVVGKTIVLDAFPSEALNGEAIIHQYSDWPTDTGETHDLLNMGADVLLQQTCLFMALYLKDAEMAAAYKTLRDEAVKTLVIAEVEGKYSDASTAMVYRGGA